MQENYLRGEARMSRAPSWDCSFHFCLLHPGLSTLFDQHRFSQARPDLRTGGRQHSTSLCPTQPQSIRGEWSHQRPARPLLPAVKPNRRFGVPWAPWGTKPFSYRRRRPPSASHITRRVLTHRVRTTARPPHLHRSLPFLCRACWPSNAGQAPCTEDTADSDGRQDLHLSMRRSPKRISQTVVPVVFLIMSKPGSVDLASPLVLPLGCLRNNLTPDTRRMRYARYDVPPLDIITPNKHGTAFSIDFSERVIPSSLLVHFPLIPAFVICLFSEASSPLSHIPSARPGLSFHTGFTSISGRLLHVWHFKGQNQGRQELQPHGYEVGHTRLVFCLMSFSTLTTGLLVSWLSMACQLIMRLRITFSTADLRLALSVSRIC